MTPPPSPRIAHVATVLLDTRVGGRHIPRDAYRKAPTPIDATARRIAARISEAAGEQITAREIQLAHALLTSALLTTEIRAIAQDTAAVECEGHYDDDTALTSGAGIGEPYYCDGACRR